MRISATRFDPRRRTGKRGEKAARHAAAARGRAKGELKWLLWCLAHALCLVALPAKAAECVWIPVCMPPMNPPADALRVYEDGVLVKEWRPIWQAYGGRTSFGHCGEPGKVITVSVVRGDEASDPNMTTVGDEDLPCGATQEPKPPMTLGSNYGPIEQLLRALHNGGMPYDTDRNGRLTIEDDQLMDRIARRQFWDSTAVPCIADVCP